MYYVNPAVFFVKLECLLFELYPYNYTNIWYFINFNIVEVYTTSYDHIAPVNWEIMYYL